MFKRIRWMSVGAAVGLGGSVWAQRRVRQTVERYLPNQVGSQAVQRVRDLRADIVDAVDEGREAMQSREAELRAHLRSPAPERNPERLSLRPAPPVIDVGEGGRQAPRRGRPGPRRRAG